MVAVLEKASWRLSGKGGAAEVLGLERTTLRAIMKKLGIKRSNKTHTTIGLNTESTYDWKGNQWQVPLNFQVGQLLKIGPQIMQLAVGARYWAESPDNGPEGWGFRLQLTLLFPK